MKTTIYGLAVAVVMLMAPQSAVAFTPTETQAIAVTDSAYLFMIDYELGYDQYDMRVPVFGTEFLLEATDPNVQVSDAEAITLGDVAVTSGSYRVAPGDIASFRYVAVVTLEEPVKAEHAVRLMVTALPFTLVTQDEKEVPNGLSSGELAQFVVETAIE